MDAERRAAEVATGLDVPLAAFRTASGPVVETAEALADRLAELLQTLHAVDSGALERIEEAEQAMVEAVTRAQSVEAERDQAHRDRQRAEAARDQAIRARQTLEEESTQPDNVRALTPRPLPRPQDQPLVRGNLVISQEIEGHNQTTYDDPSATRSPVSPDNQDHP